MRRVLFLGVLIGFVIWRGRTLDRYDRQHRHGPYAEVVPVSR